jgi:DNA-binding CsgD family transcriptional regulator
MSARRSHRRPGCCRARELERGGRQARSGRAGARPRRAPPPRRGRIGDAHVGSIAARPGSLPAWPTRRRRVGTGIGKRSDPRARRRRPAASACRRRRGGDRRGRGSPRTGEMLTPPSPAELKVLRLPATDLTAREIAAQLYLSANTVRSHTRALYRKLGVSTRADAVARAAKLGLLEQTESPR